MLSSMVVGRRMTAQQRRGQILDVTHEIVAAEGFHAATPNRIAQQAGVNRSLLYQLFGDPAGLFVALIDREAARANAQFIDVITGLADEYGESRLVRGFDGVLHAVDTQPATWRLFLFPPQGAPPELHKRLARAQAAVQGFLADELLRMYPDLADPDYTARMVLAAARELLQLRLADPQGASHERLRAAARSLAIRG